MNDWTWRLVRLGVFMVIAGIGWYIYEARKINLRKYPELAEDINKKRIAENQRALTVESLRKMFRKKNIKSSVIFSLIAGGGFFLVDWLLG